MIPIFPTVSFNSLSVADNCICIHEGFRERESGLQRPLEPHYPHMPSLPCLCPPPPPRLPPHIAVGLTCSPEPLCVLLSAWNTFPATSHLPISSLTFETLLRGCVPRNPLLTPQVWRRALAWVVPALCSGDSALELLLPESASPLDCEPLKGWN